MVCDILRHNWFHCKIPKAQGKMQIPPRTRSSITLPSRIILLMMLVLRYPISQVDQEQGRLEKYYEMDMDLCPKCFMPQTDMCSYFKDNFQFSFRHVFDIFNSLVGVKHLHHGFVKGIKGEVIAKHSYSKETCREINGFSRANHELDEILSKLFLNSDRPGFYFCHQSNLNLFIDKLTAYTSSRAETWLHLLVDIETILLAALNSHASIPTPRYYGHCGLTVYESYEGPTLHEWSRNKIPYWRKLEIALQLLNAASALSEGFDDYRIYLTDLTLDNVVYNDKTGNISLIDLDSVIIVDGIYNRSGKIKVAPPMYWKTICRHDKLDCDGCLAYQIKDFCDHYKSDFNIFSVCQLLNENLYGDETAGFLKPVPKSIDEAFPNLRVKLQKCVHCPLTECRNRFEISAELVEILATILESISR